MFACHNPSLKVSQDRRIAHLHVCLSQPSLNVSQDRRIAHMPYHALTASERETYNARRKLLAHMGDILRSKAVDREKRRLIEEDERGVRSKGFVSNEKKKKLNTCIYFIFSSSMFVVCYV
jgi:hypothetical protein